MPLAHDFGVPALAAQIPAALRTKLQKAATLVRYADGQDVHQRGDTHAGLAIVRSGAIKMNTIDRHGKTLVIAILGPGQVFGEFTVFADLPRTHTATAFGANTALDHISKARLLALMEAEPELHQFFLTSLTRRLHAMIGFAEDLRRLSPRVHAAKLLMQMARWPDGPGRVPITQSALAQTLGISRIAMGSALKALAGAGLVRTGYGHIDIVDGCALRAWLQSRGAMG